MTNQNIYYNYIYLDPRKPGRFEYPNLNFCLLYEPFYAGKGFDKRYKYHIKESKRKKESYNKLKTRKIKKILELNYNLEEYIQLLNFTNNEKEALDYEIKLIKEIGRLDLKEGTLTNLTDGGDGVAGRVTCKDKDGNTFSVTKQEFDNDDDLVNESKGLVVCRVKGTDSIIRISTLEYRNRDDLIHASVDKVTCINLLTGKYETTTKEEFNNNPNLVGTTKGKKLSNEHKIKCAHKDDKNGMANKINIYNEKDELMFECFGTYFKICKEYNLPTATLSKSYKNNGTPIYQSIHGKKLAIKNGFENFIGWYAIKLDKE